MDTELDFFPFAEPKFQEKIVIPTNNTILNTIELPKYFKPWKIRPESTYDLNKMCSELSKQITTLRRRVGGRSRLSFFNYRNLPFKEGFFDMNIKKYNYRKNKINIILFILILFFVKIILL